jgi:uncharacterized iron-regulated membrane protein
MNRWKPALLKAHRWVALAAGVLILLQGLTGALVAFRPELNRLVHPGVLVVEPSATRAPLADIAAAARGAYPDRRLTRIDAPRRPDGVYLARLETAGEGMVFAAVHPATAQVLRKGGLAAWPVEGAYQVHTVLLSGETGERVVGFTGFLILLLAISGPILWWPVGGRFRQALTVKLDADLHRGTRDLHRTAGVFAAPVLALIATTGVIMAWQPWLAPAVNLVAPVASGGAPKAAAGPCPTPATLDQAVAAAIARRPDHVIKSVRFPGKAGAVVAVYFRTRGVADPRATDHVWVEACNATVLREKSSLTAPAGTRFFGSVFWLHTGEWLGVPGRILSLLGALTLVGLVVTGVLQWASRTAKMRRNRAAKAARVSA